MTLNSYLKFLRNVNKKTQTEMAEILKSTRRTLNNYETDGYDIKISVIKTYMKLFPESNFDFVFKRTEQNTISEPSANYSTKPPVLKIEKRLDQVEQKITQIEKEISTLKKQKK